MPQTESSSAAGLTVDDIFHEQFGSIPSEPETPETSDPLDATGAPPDEIAEETAPDNAESSDAAGTPPGATPTQSAQGDPTAAADAPDQHDDLPASQPFTYTVDGQSRTWADIDVIPGHGAIIPEQALTQLQQRLAERDSLYERQQQ